MRENYRFNYLVQIEVATINGLSIVKHAQGADTQAGSVVSGADHSIEVRSKIPLANIFFKLAHEDRDFLLVNSEQR